MNGPIGRPKRRVLATLIVVIPLMIGILLWKVLPKDQITRITVPQAVHVFRRDLHDHHRLVVGDDPRPQLGVYRYETHGHEAISTTLVSGNHDYHGVSTISVMPGRCGLVERWQVLTTRWSESETCPGRDGEEIKSLREFHEFFNVGQEDRYVCKGVSGSAASKLKLGRQFASSCKSAAGTVVSETKVARAVRMRIEGKMLDVVHTRGTSLIRGSNSGSASFQDWRRRSDGLLLRRTVSSQVDSDTNGGTDYSERYSIVLLSLAPER
jgi:hypothetical protein